MTFLLDSEGASLPHDGWRGKVFKVYLSGNNDGNGPELIVTVPEWFVTEGEVEYDSCGVLYAPLQEILEQYLEDEKGIGGTIISMDGGDGLPAFVAWLRAYAKRLESLSDELRRNENATAN